MEEVGQLKREITDISSHLGLDELLLVHFGHSQVYNVYSIHSGLPRRRPPLQKLHCRVRHFPLQEPLPSLNQVVPAGDAPVPGSLLIRRYPLPDLV